MVVLQYDNSGREIVDKLPMFEEPVFTEGTECTFADWYWKSINWGCVPVG